MIVLVGKFICRFLMVFKGWHKKIVTQNTLNFYVWNKIYEQKSVKSCLDEVIMKRNNNTNVHHKKEIIK